jgi:polyisoprenoid-binding protein YceI
MPTNNLRVSSLFGIIFVVLIAACNQDRLPDNVSTTKINNPAKAEIELSPLIQVTPNPVISLTVIPPLQKGTKAQPTPPPTEVPSTPLSQQTTKSQGNSTPQQLTGTSSLTPGETRIVIAEGSVAQYLVQEQLARLDVPNDAIGSTSAIEGDILLDPDGTIRQDNSNIRVDLRTLVSDKTRRDRHLRRNTYESDRFPYAEFKIREVPGLRWPLPRNSTIPIQLTGDMTIHGVTAALTWDASITLTSSGGTVQARTNFPFETFDMKIPRLLFLLSVEDNIRLELDLVLKITAG